MTTLVRAPTALSGRQKVAHGGNGRPHPVASPGMLDGHRVTVVLPCMNESENLPLVLPRISDWVSEVVLVRERLSTGSDR